MSSLLSWASSTIIVVLFIAFIGGYFLGQRHSAEQFVTQAETDAFSDQIRAALYSFKEQPIKVSEADNGIDTVTTPTMLSSISTAIEKVSVTTQDQKEKSQKELTQYHAELIGFGAKKPAERYTEKLKKKGFPVHVRTRKSRSSKGTMITWYQVVTDTYHDKATLLELIDILKKSEKLNGVQIRTKK